MLKAPVILPNGDKIFPTKGTPQGGKLAKLNKLRTMAEMPVIIL